MQCPRSRPRNRGAEFESNFLSLEIFGDVEFLYVIFAPQSFWTQLIAGMGIDATDKIRPRSRQWFCRVNSKFDLELNMPVEKNYYTFSGHFLFLSEFLSRTQISVGLVGPEA